MSVTLTRDSDILICLLYKDYCDKRAVGYSKEKAISFGSSEDIHKNIIPDWSALDVNQTCIELYNAGLLNIFYADNIAYRTSLSDAGIIYMENRFVEGTKSIMEYLGKFKAILPFLFGGN